VLLICCGAPLLGIVGVLLGALVNSLLIMIGSAAVIAVSALVALLHRRRAKTGREG
jgi:hypothetical protein